MNAPDAPRTDAGNAERLIATHGNDLRYVPALGWLTWDSRRWASDTDGEVTRRMLDVARRQLHDALEQRDGSDERKRALQFALKSEDARRVRAAVDLASTNHAVVSRTEDLDADPWILTVGNGTVDLRTGALRQPDPGDLVTRATGVKFSPDAQAPRWERFLAEVFAGDTELIDFVQRLAGYCLTGDTREHVLIVLHGTGCNGKSTFIETLRALLGELAATAAFDTFTRSRADHGPRNDIARLRGARLVTASESSQGARLDAATVKEVTGGDTIAARFLYGEHFEFRPAFKLVLITNHRPRVDGDDDAIWRRLRLVPFDRSFEGNEDRELSARLTAELPGILSWAIDGCLHWQRDGLGAPTAVRMATEGYRADEDTLGTFLAESTTAEGTVAVGELRAAYEGWCQRHGEPSLSGSELGKRLKARGIDTGRTKTHRFYVGLSLGVTGDDDDGDSNNLPHTRARRALSETPVTARHLSPGRRRS